MTFKDLIDMEEKDGCVKIAHIIRNDLCICIGLLEHNMINEAVHRLQGTILSLQELMDHERKKYKMHYKPINFELYELYPKAFYYRWKHISHILWQLWDDRVLYTLQRLRNRYGKMSMNDWYWEGNNQYKGFRPANCGIGGILSQHKFFKAADPSPVDYTADKIREDILNDPFCNDFKYITCLEMGVSWLHFDVRNWDKEKEGILKVYP